jgi:beta-mannosidase
VYWQYNDTWPGSSWASVDYFGRWKALHYMARRFYAPILVSGAEDVSKGKVDVHVTSDRLEDARGTLTWTVTDVRGDTLEGGTRPIVIPARGDQLVESLDLRSEIEKQGASNLLVWLKLEVGGETVSENLVTLAYPRALELADPRLTANVAEGRDGEYAVTLRAERPALWAWLELEGSDAKFSDNFVHIPKAGTATIRVRPAGQMSREEVRKALRVRSLFDTYAH